MVQHITDSLISEARPVASLAGNEVHSMWDLYSRYYAGTCESQFRNDLSEKSDVIISRDPSGEIRGFSTIHISHECFRGRSIAVLFSGDTIIDHCYWARNDFAFAWIRFAAAIRSRAPSLPLYWLLIVKGHRTYRYLSVFGQRYFPSPDWETPAYEQGLLDYLAKQRFGDAYDSHSGLIRFEESHGHLKTEWAEVPQRIQSRRDVSYFLRKNPGYSKGHELACLCELSEDNLKRLTLRIFKQGVTKTAPAPMVI